MSYELSVQDKLDIVNQHLKNLEYQKFNLEMSLVEENSLTAPSQTVLDSLNNQISDVAAKKTALLAELDDLTE